MKANGKRLVLWLAGILGTGGAVALSLVVTLSSIIHPEQASAPALATDPENEAIRYSKSPATDQVAQLIRRLQAGQARLAYNPRYGYLPSLLKELGISPSSQMLVFSRTSFQRELISPRAPRALYFNDNTYVGFVQGGRALEISTADPRLGGVFYTLSQTPSGKPRIARQSFECLQCHSGIMTAGVPGHIMRSVTPRPDGLPGSASANYLTTDQSPLAERWGGWYVTGTHGAQRHLGNVVARGPEGAATMDLDSGANLTDISGRVDTTPYLTPHSDIVALMVLGHQASVHNLITRAGYAARSALHDGRLREDPALSDLPVAVQDRIREACEPLVRGLLFCGEAPLTEPVRGTSPFAAEFAARGPRDHAGRSLRDFDLNRRLFRYPCSFLIYSAAFDALPVSARQAVYARLHEALEGSDTGRGFSHLTAGDRRAIVTILTETRPEFAAAR